jgi:hypothetical protein
MLARRTQVAIGRSLDRQRPGALPNSSGSIFAATGRSRESQGPEASRVAPQARSASQPVTGQGKIGCPRDGREVFESSPCLATNDRYWVCACDAEFSVCSGRGLGVGDGHEQGHRS